MNKFFLFPLSLFLLFSLFACKKIENNKSMVDNNSYINDFEITQENINSDTTIKITSPKAIINSINNNIEIFDSSIKILKKGGQDIVVKAGNSTLDNYKNLLRAYNSVYINLIGDQESFVKTNSFDWDLNTSNINFKSPLFFNSKNTKIVSSSGFYDIESGLLKINDNIFTRNILNNKGKYFYRIKILADKAKWLKDENSLEFMSNNKQVESTIDILAIK